MNIHIKHCLGNPTTRTAAEASSVGVAQGRLATTKHSSQRTTSPFPNIRTQTLAVTAISRSILKVIPVQDAVWAWISWEATPSTAHLRSSAACSRGSSCGKLHSLNITPSWKVPHRTWAASSGQMTNSPHSNTKSISSRNSERASHFRSCRVKQDPSYLWPRLTPNRRLSTPGPNQKSHWLLASSS